MQRARMLIWERMTKAVKRLFTNATITGTDFCASNQLLIESVK